MKVFRNEAEYSLGPSVVALGTFDGVHLEPIPGMIPNLWNLPSGCRFSNRCAEATPRCLTGLPPLYEVEEDHFVSCFKYAQQGEEDTDE